MSYYITKILFILQKIVWRFRYACSTQNINVSPNSISIIVVGRNDNYGGDFSLRLKTTIDWNLKQLPGAELIYIEWNKIAEKESDCLWIEKRYPNSKCYTVSNQVHQSINANSKMPVMEYFAKNMGIQKATNDWILMINADCLIGNDTLKNIKKLSKKYVYGTHYVSFNWDGLTITNNHLSNKAKYTFAFPAWPTLESVVGNFILTHKSNWLYATGYDESLTNVRAGVDANGLNQLLHLGLKPMVIGHHYHLDHPESMIHGANDTHGIHSFKNIPYKNKSNWGFNNVSLKKISERIWDLEKI